MINTNYSTGNTITNTACLQAYAASNNAQSNQSVQSGNTYSADDTAVVLTLSSEALATYNAAGPSILKVGSNDDAVRILESNLKKLGFFTATPNKLFTDITK